VRHVARHAQGGLHFHDLRHSFATWLVTEGVPINDVQQVMGHEQASTTLDRYTHSAPGRNERVLGALADFLLTPEPEQDTPEDESDDNQGDDLR
jgi:integrase